MTDNIKLKLGLIGGNIKASKAPILHRLAGQQNQIDVTYDLLIPKELGQEFDEVFSTCQASYNGINVTYPYKELAAKKVAFKDEFVQAIGAVNTVVFDGETAIGWNTDFSGFVKAYKASRDEPPGDVLMLGAGGVGRAIAFALIRLGASSIAIYDLDFEKASALCAELSDRGANSVALRECPNGGYSGLVNCSPLGMVGIGGTPLSSDRFGAANWAFDAVYTPIETIFLKDAKLRGMGIISGYELFFYQGVDAWHHFSGLDLDEGLLRHELNLRASA